MKSKALLLVLLIAAAGAAAGWFAVRHQPAPAVAANGRKIRYYQSPMHSWIKSDKPGKCPICGMNLVPVYESEGTDNTNAGFGLKLSAASVSVANVETAPVHRQPLARTLQVAGTIAADTLPASFAFNAYERDFAWLSVGQTVEVTIPALPGKIYRASIIAVGTKLPDPDRTGAAHGTQVRATLSEYPAPAGGVKSGKPVNGFYAEGRVLANSPDVLAVPRNAVLQPGAQPFVYVDEGRGYYERREVKLGRVGDEFVELLDGLQPGEKVVTSGGLLIDAEAQITQNSGT